MLGVLLGLTFAALMGGASIFTKRGLQRESFEVALTMSLVVSSPVFLVIAALTTDLTAIPLRVVGWAVLGALLGSFVGRSSYFLSIHYIGPSKALTLTAVAPLFGAILATTFLREPLTVLVGAGTLVIVVGVVLISQDTRSEVAATDASPWVLVLPLFAALALASAVVVRKFVLTEGLAPFQAAAINMTAPVAPAVYLLKRRRLTAGAAPLDRTALKQFGIAALIMTVAFTCYFFGLARTRASVFFPLVQTQSLFATFFSGLLFSELELHSPRSVLGTVAVVCGAALVVLG